MAKRVCPWWLGYLLASPLRRLMQDPGKILAPYVREGMTVLEPGPGMGFFTLELARLVGPSGRVVAVDLQPRMIDRLKRRAARVGLLERVDARLAARDSMGVSDLAGTVDFALAFAIVHELPAADSFFTEVAGALKPGACLLLAEPTGHVNVAQFEDELEAARHAGLGLADRPSIRRSRTALLKKV
jgi:SAM-dependent methyltransferase